MSSRNLYLNGEERTQALALSLGLQKARKYFASGVADYNHVDKLINLIRQQIQQEPLAKVEYIEILDEVTLDNIEYIELSHKALAAVAVKFGNTRLIDNTVLG